MIGTIITAVVGFGVGLWYAKGKPEPFCTAMHDMKRFSRKGVAVARQVYEWWKKVDDQNGERHEQ